MATPLGIAFYRKCCQPPLTQKTLAQALGVDRNTIYLWERNGVPSPGELLRLTTLFVERGALTSDADTAAFWRTAGASTFPEPPELRALFAPQRWQLPSAALPDPAPPPAGSLLPLRRNPLFVGREVLLPTLAQVLSTQDATVAITGLAGIGKTQLAAEFAHRYGQFFPAGVFWISFADPASVMSAIAASDTDGGHGDLSLAQQAERVLQIWQDATPRLLIFDNCEDEALLARWRPAYGGSRVIVTSRRAHWDATLITSQVPLSTFDRPASLRLLRAHLLGAGVTDAPPAPLEAIAELLGDLPLALHLAGSHIAHQAPFLVLDHYVAELHSAPGATHPSLVGASPSPTGHHQHLDQVLALAIAQLDPAQPVDAQARALLARAAHFAPGEPLPIDLLLATAGLTASAASPALARLIGDLGLLERGAAETVRVHRLIAATVRAAHSDPDVQGAVEQAILDLARRFSDGGHVAPAGLLAHLRAVATAAKPRSDLRAVRLANALGWQLYLARDFEASITWLIWGLATLRAAPEPNAIAMSESLELLGLLYQMREDMAQAEACYAESLALRQQTHGPDHPESAALANNLGYFITFYGNQYDRAYAYIRHAVAIRRRMFGLAHADTARSLRNLGFAAYKLGRYSVARRYLRLALRCFERAEGAYVIARAQTLMHLGEVALACGDAYAEPYFAEMLALRLSVRAPDDGEIAESYWQVGRAALARGDTASAAAAFARAERIYVARPWPNRYVLSRMRGDQAALELRRGNPARAADLIGEAHQHWEQLRPDHVDRAEIYLREGQIALATGAMAAARKHLTRAVALRELVLGPNHPATRAAQTALIGCPDR